MTQFTGKLISMTDEQKEAIYEAILVACNMANMGQSVGQFPHKTLQKLRAVLEIREFKEETND